MDKHDEIAFLFNIAKEIKKSYESPVILITSKDYADGIYRTLLHIRTALMHNASPLELAQITNNFHLEWLQAVKDIENFRKRINETPREVVLRAIDYTINCMSYRYEYFNNFIQTVRSTMPAEDRLIMQADLEIMNDMKNTVSSVLHDKKHCFQIHADHHEYTVKVNYEVDELLNWLDRIYDSLALQICKVFHICVPHLPCELSKTLKQIIEEVAGTSDPEATVMLNQMESRGKLLSTMVRYNASHELEVSKVVEKINVLERRMDRLQEKKSSAVLALQHKVIYLEERLQSLQNLKMSLNALQLEKSRELEDEEILESTEINIFNHYLPPEARCRLVERLVKLWDNALNHDRGKSIISILSVADMKEVYTDEIGEFTIDMYGRKIYPRGNTNYQLNERHELVELNDDEKHVYFYDDCGRYFLDHKRHRIYKAHDNASEYELYPTGQMIKLSETRDGIEYRFDHRGRYYVNANGEHIYTDLETGEKYELDGFGNLVRIRSKMYVFDPCPTEPIVVKECKYLQQTVGNALKTCLANVLLRQPADPIAFLADNLVKYRQNIEDKQKRLNKKKDMDEERQYYDLGTASALLQSNVSAGEISKSSYYDPNLKTYQTMIPDDE